MESMLIKYFFMFFCCLYTYKKILNLQLRKYDTWCQLLFSLLAAPLVGYIRTHFPLITLFVLALLLELFAVLRYNTKPTINFYASILAFGISYVLSLLSAIGLSLFLLIPLFSPYTPSFPASLFSLFVGVLQTALTILLFKSRRLKKGIPDFAERFSGDIGIFLGILILLLASMAYIDETTQIIPAIIICLTVITGVGLYFWYRSYMKRCYITRMQKRNEKILEDKIKSQDVEIERLSKIIHKDNKLIGALQLSLNQFQTELTSEQSQRFLEELEALTAQRADVLSSYTHKGRPLTATGVFLIDIMLNYLNEKAASIQCVFDVSIAGSVSFMSGHIIAERDLSTLIADIGENALIAISTEKIRKALLFLGVKNNHYRLDVYDSGSPFSRETIEMLGKRRYTTHEKSGGSGIGLMTVLELARKYKASFEIEEMTGTDACQKRVSVVFDTLSQIRIYTQREAIISACKARPADVILVEK